MNRRIGLVRGILLGGLIAWGTIRYGGVEPADSYILFMGLAALFLLSFPDGIRVEWWGYGLLVPLVPMAFNGSFPYDILKFASLWLVAVVGAHQAKRDWEAGRRLSPLIVILLATGLFEALLGLAQSLGRFAGRDIPFSPMGTIVNRNHFAGFLEMLIPLVFMIGFARFYDRRRLSGHGRSRTALWEEHAARAWIFLVAGALLFLAVLFSLSRGGTLAAMIGTVAAAYLVLRRSAGRRHTHSRPLAAGIALLVVAGALWIGIQPVFERFFKVPEGAVDRTDIWRGTAEIIRDNPLLGVGAGMHGWAFTRYQDRNPGIFYDHAHNDYLEAAAEWGIPAAAVFFVVVFIMIGRAGSACLKSADPARAALIAGGIGGVTALLVHSLVDFNLHIPSSALLFGVVLGMTAAFGKVTEVEIIKYSDDW
jgi:O-antigen ligase